MNVPVYKIHLWNLLVATGGALDEARIGKRSQVVDYFGGTLKVDRARTEVALAHLRETGIDYNRSSDVSDGLGEAFDGSHNDPARVPYLVGRLVTGDGLSYQSVTTA